MRRNRCITAALCVGALGAPVLLKPDYFANFGSTTDGAAPETESVPGGRKRTVFAYYGNQGSNSENTVQINLRATLLAGTVYQGMNHETELCTRRVVTTLPAQAASKVMAFTLLYPPSNRVVPGGGKPRTYRLTASTTQPDSYFAPFEEASGNAGNNHANVTITAPEGGTPSCSVVIDVRVRPNVVPRP